MLLPGVNFLEWVDILQGGVGLPSTKGFTSFNFYFKVQEKQGVSPVFSLIFYYISSYGSLRSFVDFFLSVAAVVRGVVWMVAALRRVFGPIDAFVEVAMTIAVGALEIRGGKSSYFHKEIDDVLFLL